MVKRVKLADILWQAANTELACDDYDRNEQYSCFAIFAALRKSGYYESSSYVCKYISELGCEPFYTSKMIESFEGGEVRQGVRYMWLLIAMHVAEDEGIYLEL